MYLTTQPNLRPGRLLNAGLRTVRGVQCVFVQKRLVRGAHPTGLEQSEFSLTNEVLDQLEII